MHIIRTVDYPTELYNPKGETIQEILGLRGGGIQSHSLAKVTIPPGNASACHFHKVSNESYLILSGRAELVINQQVFQLTSGDAVLIEPLDVHQISNQSEQDLVFLAVCVPAWHPEDSFDVDQVESAS